MPDLPDLNTTSGQPISPEQIHGILAQIDLDIMNLVRDGKLSALKYGVPGPAGQTTDRAANMHALLAARDHYQKLLQDIAAQPVWLTSRGDA